METLLKNKQELPFRKWGTRTHDLPLLDHKIIN